MRQHCHSRHMLVRYFNNGFKIQSSNHTICSNWYLAWGICKNNYGDRCRTRTNLLSANYRGVTASGSHTVTHDNRKHMTFTERACERTGHWAVSSSFWRETVFRGAHLDKKRPQSRKKTSKIEYT